MPESHCVNPTEPGREHKRRIWQSHIARWQQSGLNQAAYCREHGLKPHQFTYWKNRFDRTDTDITFVPLFESSWFLKKLGFYNLLGNRPPFG